MDSEVFRPPLLEKHEDYIKFFDETIPLNPAPQVFGFHPNADITKDINETNMLLDSMLLCSS